jgi:hypothetical protein
MVHLRDNFFALQVDDDAIGEPFIEDGRLMYSVSRISCSLDSRMLPKGDYNYKPIYVTHSIPEIYAKLLVESYFGDNYVKGNYRNYDTMIMECQTATSSLTSLLKSKGLDTEKNYAIIEKI